MKCIEVDERYWYRICKNTTVMLNPLRAKLFLNEYIFYWYLCHSSTLKQCEGFKFPVNAQSSYTYIVCAVSAGDQGAVSIRKTVLPGMAIPMLKIRRPNGRLIFNMEIAIRR